MQQSQHGADEHSTHDSAWTKPEGHAPPRAERRGPWSGADAHPSWLSRLRQLFQDPRAHPSPLLAVHGSGAQAQLRHEPPAVATPPLPNPLHTRFSVLQIKTRLRAGPERAQQHQPHGAGSTGKGGHGLGGEVLLLLPWMIRSATSCSS